jgi:hypothetical protein
MDWKVTLYGGPFDGDTSIIEVTPEAIWVTPCPENGDGCGSSHWYGCWVKGGERYDRDEVDDREQTAVYVYSDLELDPVPVLAFEDEMPRELQRA